MLKICDSSVIYYIFLYLILHNKFLSILSYTSLIKLSKQRIHQLFQGIHILRCDIVKMSPKNKKKRLKTKEAKPFDPDTDKGQPKFIDKGIAFTSVSGIIRNESGPLQISSGVSITTNEVPKQNN